MRTLHELEGLVAVPRHAHLENVERAIMATYKHLFFYIIKGFKTRSWSSQNNKPLCQRLPTVDPHGRCNLTPRRHNALNALPHAMSIAAAKPDKVQD